MYTPHSISTYVHNLTHCVFFLFYTYSSSPDSPPSADSAKSVGSTKPVHSAKPTAKKAKSAKTKATSKKQETSVSGGVVCSTNILST